MIKTIKRWWFHRTTRMRWCGNPDCMAFHDTKHWWEP